MIIHVFFFMTLHEFWSTMVTISGQDRLGCLATAGSCLMVNGSGDLIREFQRPSFRRSLPTHRPVACELQAFFCEQEMDTA